MENLDMDKDMHGGCTFRRDRMISPSDGLEIGILVCVPETGVRGVVQLVHGMCEHK